MRCIMCPRTSLMTRSLKQISDSDFESLLDQIRPYTEKELEEFWSFIQSTYKSRFDERSENAFYFYVISRCLTLHGYGEPLLDSQLVQRVMQATDRNIPTYLSCVPANLSVDKARELMSAGLTVLKVSIDALSNEGQKAIRGRANNFDKAFETVKAILEMKSAEGHKTLVAPTMIALGGREQDQTLHTEFLDLWKGLEVYAYVKSQDNRWLYEDDPEMLNTSHYESQYCEYPWTSVTVLANGSVVPCTQDYDDEISFGNIRTQTLKEIWNSPAYQDFRLMHIRGEFPKGHKCSERCDQKKISNYLKKS